MTDLKQKLEAKRDEMAGYLAQDIYSGEVFKEERQNEALKRGFDTLVPLLLEAVDRITEHARREQMIGDYNFLKRVEEFVAGDGE